MEQAVPAEEDPLLRCLVAIASPTRLALLRALRVESRLGDIDVRIPEEDGRRRRLARQTIKFHLEALAEVGMVSARETTRPEGPTTEYFLDHQRFYALSEEVKALARLRPAVEPGTATAPRAPPHASRPAGPLLLLVKGLDEGATFPLAPGPRAQWVLGRSRGCEVALDFDPSISQRNALLTWEEGRHVLEDIPTSRNGTLHNLRRLAPGERVPLSHGDVVGLGRSALVYWA